MASIPERFTGDTWKVLVTLKVDGTARDVSGASDISALVASSNDDTATVLINAASQSNTGNADWANGIVEVIFASANTGISSYGRKYIEIQVTESGEKETWPRVPIEVRKGLIS